MPRRNHLQARASRGRAGMEGEAISLVCDDEHRQLKGIEQPVKRSIERVLEPGFEQSAHPAARPGRATAARQGADAEFAQNTGSTATASQRRAAPLKRSGSGEPGQLSVMQAR